MSNVFKATALVLAFIAVASAFNYGAYKYPSRCSKIKPPMDFSYEKFAGLWFDRYHTANVNYSCSNYTYSTIGNNEYIAEFTALNAKGKPYDSIVSTDLRQVFSPKQTTVFNIKSGYFYNMPVMFMLDIDYDKYFIAYVCTMEYGYPLEMAYGEARADYPLSLDMVMDVLHKHNLGHLVLIEAQENCPRRN